MNRYDEAVRAGKEAIERKIETVPTRRLLYQLVVLARDTASARAHLEWARDTPREFDLIGAEAQVAAFEGRVRDARELYRQTTETCRSCSRRGPSTTASSAVQRHNRPTAVAADL